MRNIKYKRAEKENQIICLYLTMSMENTDIEELYKGIQERSHSDNFAFAVIEVNHWNDELSPWVYQDVDRNKNFGGKGKELLKELTEQIMPQICKDLLIKKEEVKWILGGYSLAGLFSVWAMYETEEFDGCVSCSGSLWYPSFGEYISKKQFSRKRNFYLSLGKKEEKNKDRDMQKVGDVTRAYYDNLQKDDRIEYCTLEWNDGNHFTDVTKRVEKGFAWCIYTYCCNLRDL